MITSLAERVEHFVERGARADDLLVLLKECVEAGGLEGLRGVRRLFEDMYGGMTFNAELKAPAASTLLIWGELGLDALMEAVNTHSTSKNFGIAMRLLAAVAAGEGPPIFTQVCDEGLSERINQASRSPELSRTARRHLINLILSVEDEEDVCLRVGGALQSMSFAQTGAARELFAALSKRWLAVGAPVLDRLAALIRDEPANEPVFQAFLTAHPQILDPLAVRVWPQPDLFGAKEPDFVVQRADGTYIVVEIEAPAKRLITGGGHLAAEATHAEAQAADYRRYLIKHFAEAEKHFPDFQEPDCLVVVGLEHPLNAAQRQALQAVNRNRSHLQIVGFDWLLNRARTISQNMTQPTVEVRALRIGAT